MKLLSAARLLSVLLVSLVVSLAGADEPTARVEADDWPTYRRDAARSGITPRTLEGPLTEAWVVASSEPPVQAWPGPAKWDAYHEIQGLKDRMVFDRALHVVGQGERVYFGSPVDDSIHCLDLTTGRTLWSHATEAPVRLAPTLAKGKVYAGSDDGHVYCLDAEDGRRIWKTRLGPRDVRLAGNGRVISLWPVRSGVLVMGDRVYAAAGVLPWEEVILAALDAETGKPHWKQSGRDLPAQGYLLASPSRIYVTAGRERPVVHDRETGKRLFQVKGGGGGTYALLVGDQILHGPGRAGELSAHAEGRGDQLASYQGHHMIVRDGTAFLLSDEHLTRLDRDEHLRLFGLRTAARARRDALRKQLKKSPQSPELKEQVAAVEMEIAELEKQLLATRRWRVRSRTPYSMVLAGKHLIAGGDDRVAAHDAETGERVWELPVDGEAQGLAVVGGHLLVSTHRGKIHCFRRAGAGESPAEVARARPRIDLVPGGTRRRDRDSIGVGVPGVQGPILHYIAPRTVRVTWKTRKSSTTHLRFGEREFAPEGHRKEHEVVVTGVSHQQVYFVEISGAHEDGTSWKAPRYEFDGSFYYLPSRAGLDPARPISSPLRRALAAMEGLPLTSSEPRSLGEGSRLRGYALVLGAGSGEVVRDLVASTELELVVVEPDPVLRRALLARLREKDLLGTRVSVIDRPLDDLPFVPYLANLITWGTDDPGVPVALESVYRYLRPEGGVLLGSARQLRVPADRKLPEESAEITGFREKEEDWHVVRRGRLPGAGEWAHQYGPADNSACSGDTHVRGELGVLWFGRPGPRPMPDRGPRNPAPLASGGRLYVQGNRTLFGLDAYNGTILWARQLPTMRRANLPRDCSNMVATPDALYVALAEGAIAFEGRTGDLLLDLDLPESPRKEERHWGYLATRGRALLGSGVWPGSQYLGDQGEWYEHFKEDQISRVASEYLFSMDRFTGSENWRYEGGAILNASIAVRGERVYFLEGRSEKAVGAKGRLGVGELGEKQHLVALDLHTGEKIWEQALDLSLLQYVTYLAVGEGRIIISGTDEQKKYHIHALEEASGKPAWEHHQQAEKDHHSGHLGRPVIIGQRLYLNQHTYDLASGEVLRVEKFDYHGCGTQAASAGAIFHRFEYHGMLDLETGKRTEFLGVRGGCWLGQIPAQGLLLAPETGSGCSCTHAFQTSLAFYPRPPIVPVPEKEADS